MAISSILTLCRETLFLEVCSVFEIGPIRPPSEAESLLLRITRNCPWNKCKFCTIYKKHKFSTRPIEDIKADIDRIALFRDKIRGGYAEDLNKLPDEDAESALYIMRWIANGEESVFLQDANALVLSYDKFREVLVHLRKKLPWVKRVTTYGRVDSINRLSVEQLTGLREAGLDRIHSGYESGADAVLSYLNKGHTKAQEIEAGQKVKAAGIELSVYFMPGAGGKSLSDHNAAETADVINKVNPDFVRVRTFIPQRGTEVLDEISAGQRVECTDKEKALELKKMIEHISGASGNLFSDHIINLFENVNGNMTADKERMLFVFADFEGLGEDEQRMYQVARRMSMVGSTQHMALLNNAQKDKIFSYLSQLETDADFEAFLLKLLQRYI